MIVVGCALFFQLMFDFVALLVILASRGVIRPEEPHQGEYYALMLLALVGMMFTAAATDLFVLFLAFETSSLSTFALVAYRKRDKQATEASVKFFIIGSVSSGIVLFGISLIYGIAGTTSIGTTTDLLPRPGGVHPDRHPGRRGRPPFHVAGRQRLADRRGGAGRRDAPRVRLRRDEGGCLPRRRGHGGSRPPGRHGGLQGPEPANAVPRVRDDRVPLQPRGDPAPRRLLLEVRALLQRGQCRVFQRMVPRARRVRRPEQRSLPVLLRPGRLVHVHP